jgi:hypothetical protein
MTGLVDAVKTKLELEMILYLVLELDLEMLAEARLLLANGPARVF